LIAWLCLRLPSAMRPDHLTMVGMAGGMAVFAGFALSNIHPAWLWLSFLGIILNWVGDSLDGSLARFRKCERPNYGFFVDHMTDSFTMTLIGVGAGLSPLLSMAACLLVLIAYLLLTVMSVLEAKVRGILRISFGKVGPTEFRVFMLVMIGFLYGMPAAQLTAWGMAFNVYDAILLVTAAALTCVSVVCALRIAGELAREDPGSG
jgi:archaetidylinositol phosphate synthase